MERILVLSPCIQDCPSFFNLLHKYEGQIDSRAFDICFLSNVNLQVDYEMALEYATHSGVKEEPREPIYIQSLEAEKQFIDFHCPIFVFRLFQ